MGSNAITNIIGMNFVKIPEGIFMMGSPNNEPSRYDDETHHQVTISKPFFMQTTQTTQGQWKMVTGKNPSRLTNWFLIHDDYPVTNVTWDDVQQFIQKLNRMERTDKYRLPTEAEWEYGLHPSSWTKYVRVVGRIEHPGRREKGSCHEATKKIQHRAQTSGC